MPKKIKSLEELRNEKELLKMKMKITQQAFTGNVKQNRYQAQRLLVNKIALPIGAGALASWVIQALINQSKDQDDVAIMEMASTDEAKNPKLWWIPIARTLIGFLQTYLDQVDPVYTDAPSENGHTINPDVTSEEPAK